MDRYTYIIDYFSRTMPNPKSELNFRNEYELLVAVMLSAQCTDRRVNQVTPSLFVSYPDIESLAQADEAQILSLISSVSYPNAKARHLKAMAQKVLINFGGKIPKDLVALTSLPGVGQKTANVMIAVAFGGQAMPVDTHVFRVSNRIGLTTTTTPKSTEKVLVRHFPHDILSKAHHWLLLHGRYTCTAIHPKCNECGLIGICRYYQKSTTLRDDV